MADCCSGGCAPGKPPVDPAYRRILWIALAVNAAMFGVELLGGWAAGSVALLADAVDFFGDAANYGISLFILGMAPVWRSRTALVKGASMGVYGVFVIGSALLHLAGGTVPAAATMGVIGCAALAANGLVAMLLFAWRDGDANMRSVWLCTRNDMIGNLAVLLAALGVWQAGSGLPDLLVAVVMGALGLSAARSVILQARQELRQELRQPPAAVAELKRP